MATARKKKTPKDLSRLIVAGAISRVVKGAPKIDLVGTNEVVTWAKKAFKKTGGLVDPRVDVEAFLSAKGLDSRETDDVLDEIYPV